MKVLMRMILILVFIASASNAFAQAKDTSRGVTRKTTDTVSFIIKFDINTATKDGFYLNGFVVDIDYDQAKKINGKKIKVTGEVTVVKSLRDQSDDDKDGNRLIKQGRFDDTKHILKPSIEILN